MIQALSSLRKTPYQSASAILVLFFSLFLVAMLFISVTFLNGLLSYIETRPQVTVYFQSSIEEADILKVRDELLATGKVSEILYISKEDAYEIYRELTKDNPLLLEMTSPSILPASLEIYATRPDYLLEIADYLSTTEGVDEVQFQEVIVDRLLNLTSVIRQTALALTVFLAVMSVVVMAATTSFKIALRRDEIMTLQLLGASNFYIIRPFLSQGMLIAFIASVLAIGAVFGVHYALTPFLQGYLQGLPDITIGAYGVSFTVWPSNPVFFLVTFGIIFLYGIVITLLANVFATNKYLS